MWPFSGCLRRVDATFPALALNLPVLDLYIFELLDIESTADRTATTSAGLKSSVDRPKFLTIATMCSSIRLDRLVFLAHRFRQAKIASNRVVSIRYRTISREAYMYNPTTDFYYINCNWMLHRSNSIRPAKAMYGRGARLNNRTDDHRKYNRTNANGNQKNIDKKNNERGCRNISEQPSGWSISHVLSVKSEHQSV